MEDIGQEIIAAKERVKAKRPRIQRIVNQGESPEREQDKRIAKVLKELGWTEKEYKPLGRGLAQEGVPSENILSLMNLKIKRAAVLAQKNNSNDRS